MSIISSPEDGSCPLNQPLAAQKSVWVFVPLSMTIFEDYLNDYSSVVAIRSLFVDFDLPTVIRMLV